MRGTLILRLVDITLLLLLSLMAAAAIRTTDVEFPEGSITASEGSLLLPLEAVITSQGYFTTIDNNPTTLRDIIVLSMGREAGVQFLADKDAPVTTLLQAHATLQEYGIEVVFLVQKTENG